MKFPFGEQQRERAKKSKQRRAITINDAPKKEVIFSQKKKKKKKEKEKNDRRLSRKREWRISQESVYVSLGKKRTSTNNRKRESRDTMESQREKHCSGKK